MSKLPRVKEEVEFPLGGHIFRLRRLNWIETIQATAFAEATDIDQQLAICAFACHNISGRATKPEEVAQILSTVPKAIRLSLYSFYMGSLDPHRKFETKEVYTAPDALVYARQLDEEKDKVATAENLEGYLSSKFGPTEAKEELELGRKIAQQTGFAGAQVREQIESGELDG